MLGLFGTLSLGQRSLQAQQQGIEVTGHNLANVDNPAYARQRIDLQTGLALPTPIGPEGTGVDVASIQQLRDAFLDQQITTETSVTGSLDAQQQALQYLQADLGEKIDTTAVGPEGTAAAQGTGGHGLAADLSDFFNAFQSLSTNPSSLAERQVLLMKAQALATDFNQANQRLAERQASLNSSLQTDVASANQLLTQIADLNGRIAKAETASPGVANDLRDSRQAQLEALAKLVKFDSTTDATGAVDVVVGGVTLVSGSQATDSLETYDPGSGALLVRAHTAGTSLALTGGRLEGTVTVRDGALATLDATVNSLAGLLINDVNAIHKTGYGLNGTSNAPFFTGTDAGTIGVNTNLVQDPSLLQASATAGAAGDNQIALQLAQLAAKTYPSLSGQTLSQGYSQAVAGLGQNLASVNNQVSDQQSIASMLTQQRQSVGGVSLDEEMTNLLTYQKAYQASARLITTINELLDTVINLKS